VSTFTTITYWHTWYTNCSNGQPHKGMNGCLLALDKNLGVQPIGIGDTWHWVLAKCILQVAGSAATEARGVNQLCCVGVVSAGIEGNVHLMQHACLGYLPCF